MIKLNILSFILMGILIELSHQDKPVIVTHYHRVGDGSTKIEGEDIKGVDMSGMDRNAIKMAYCEQGNTQVKRLLELDDNPLSKVGEIGVFKVVENVTLSYHVNGCECIATRSFLLRTEDLNDGPISVHILKNGDTEV